MANVTNLLLFLLCMSSQDVFCIKNNSYSYTVGLIYDKGVPRDAIIKSARKASSKNFKIIVENSFVTPYDAYESYWTTCSIILNHPTVGIFGPFTKPNVDPVQSISDAKNIPNILTEDVGVLKGNMQLSVYPSPTLLSEAYIDVLSSMHWEQATFLYTSEKSTTWESFLTQESDPGIVFDIEFIDPYNPDEERNVIQRLKNAGKTHFIVDCSEKDIMRILSIFQNFGMITENYHYFFTGIETHGGNISTFRSSGVDIVKMQLLSSNAVDDLRKYDFFSNVPRVSEVLAFDAFQMFAQALESFKPVQKENVSCENDTQWEEGEDFLYYIIRHPYTGLSGYISIGPERYRNTFQLFINRLMPDGLTEVGTWDPTKGITYTNLSESDTSIVEDWKSKPLVVSIALVEPYVRIKASPYSLHGNDRYEGFAVDVIEELSKTLNFTYTFEVAGTKGVISPLVDGEADLAIADITATSERLYHVDFTVPIIYTGISILFQKPMKAPPSVHYFTKPLSTDFLIAIAISFVTATVSLLIVGRLCDSEWQKPKATSNYVSSQLTLSNTVWFVAGSLFRQNTQVKIRSIPGRIIAASWWLLCFMVIAMYIASLASHLIKFEENADVLFSDVESLVKNADKYDIHYGAKLHGATMDFFKFSEYPLYQEIYQHMMDNPDDIIRTTAEAVTKAEEERYAFFTDAITIDYITGQHCQLTKYGGLINENAQGIALRKNSPYRNILSKAILKLQVSGKLEKLKEKWWKGPCHIEYEANDSYPISLVDVEGLMYLTIFGTVVALISAVTEFVLYVYKKSKKLKSSFFKVLKLEVKHCFKGNTKSVVDRKLISKPVPENEDHEATEGTIELI